MSLIMVLSPSSFLDLPSLTHATDADMAAMYLTAARQGHPRPPAEHAELELLLESFQTQVQEALAAADAIQVIMRVF
jgi:hypothetical protein